jgi:uncharacterized protein
VADIDYTQLEKRLGRQHLAQRLNIQSHHAARLFGAGRTWFHLEHIRSLHRLIRRILKISGIYRIGHRNALCLRTEYNEVLFPELPAAFDGFRILHISDTHLDGIPELIPVIQQKIRNLRYDLCVITGDFREGTFEDYELPMRHMADLRNSLTAPAYAVLGNHDCIEMVPLLEACGIRVLLNERTLLERGGSGICLLGVDDPHYYETDNLEKAISGVPDNTFCILLSHSPEITRKAAFAGVDFYLCGHTHGGQICLPGGRPVLANSRCPHNQRKGAWQYEKMQGYTSRGAGTSSVPVRFNCPPEITVHILRRMT